MKLKIAPSLLSADFAKLKESIRSVERAGADMLHIDVMDGHFVPNITVGPVVVKDVRRVTRLPLDVHLMIEDPVRFLDAFVAVGSDMITMHVETVAASLFKREARRMRARGVKIGVSLNPDTALSKIKPYLSDADFVLVMTVHPGFGGQKFIEDVVPKIRALRRLFEKDIAVDGGINETTARRVVEAGANVLAAGSYIFGAKNQSAAIKRLRNAANK
jgi:ribulose-phosphate 3-epimerase